MAAKFVHAVDTRYKPARKVRVPEQHLDIFPYLKARDPKSETQKANTAATETKTTPKGGK
ncbi:hypothetical protein [Brevibacterium linens]|uniref:Uncharacterized protein n=1 Tax=Brevibacterium linens TaxID=1703 RepID=A0A0B9AAC8_BRELN|nr:hypothetical protein [Brevibacterium linens]KHS52546.1 hypothetical protein AE0388_1529 [Brevibacterium linens]